MKPDLSVYLTVSVAVVATILPAVAAFGESQRLECTLADTDSQRAVAQRSVAIVFDEEAATMRLEEGGRTRSLTNVSISMTSMSGNVADMTIGVSRSSLRIVLQTYRKSSVQTEFGTCELHTPTRPATPPRAR